MTTLVYSLEPSRRAQRTAPCSTLTLHTPYTYYARHAHTSCDCEHVCTCTCHVHMPHAHATCTCTCTFTLHMRETGAATARRRSVWTVETVRRVVYLFVFLFFRTIVDLQCTACHEACHACHLFTRDTTDGSPGNPARGPGCPARAQLSTRPGLADGTPSMVPHGQRGGRWSRRAAAPAVRCRW